MARYISLIRFTPKGAQSIKQSTRRARSFESVAKKAGVTVEGKYWTLGPYDGVLILKASKPEKALHCLTELVKAGYVTTETLPAFDEKEFNAILK